MDQHHENLGSSTSREAATSCESIENRIHELMDLRQSLLSDEQVRNHIKDCDQCAELIVDFGALNESLSQIPLETLHRLSGMQAPPEQRTQRHLHPFSFVATVACVLLACLTSGIWFGPSQDDPIPTRIEMVSTPLPPTSSVASEVNNAIEGTPHQMVFTPAFHLTPAFHKTDFINTVSLEQISGGVEPYQNYIDMTADLPGIQPVSKSVNATLHIIRSISERPSSDRGVPPKAKDIEDGPDFGVRDSLEMQLCCV